MHRLTALVLLITLLLAAAPVHGWALPPRQANEPDAHIDALLAAMTPQERVGQLLIVTFEGSSLHAETTIARLIAQYNIGGVVLLAENDNINGQVNTPRLVQSLTQELQMLAYDGAAATTDRETPRPFIPLFIATSHDGDGQPGMEIAKDTTPVPSFLALGATWNAGYARQVGQIVGTELSAMGINMLLGPPLNVAQQPQSEQAIDLGVNTFGGEPYWVGQMGQAYITGVHEGSQGHVAVIVRDFPGLGLADTRPDQEIPVVPRTREQLRDFDLIPFNAVTGGAGDTLARADGMQCASIRYQGATIRAITGPVCVNEDAASQLLRLPFFTGWRENGVIVSSPLGTRAMRRHYTVTPFPHRQVAREAFLAGNDILFLSDFGPQRGSDQLANVVDVIHFFAERYEDDPVFRARVDQSLRRILRLKLALYDSDLSLDNVLLPVNDINAVGGYGAELYSVAEQAVTLLAPRRESLPPPPQRNENIVIFTDVRLVQQCSYCATYPLVSVNALESAIERLYGPYADAQIRPEQVVSFSFSQLAAYLDGDPVGTSADTSQLKTNQRIGEALRDVDWIIYVMLNATPDVPESTIVRHLLERDSSIVQRAKVVGIALGAPTYLSSTEVSKFTAFYGLYSHTPPFIDAAARAIFQDGSFSGAPPLSVPAVGYDVFVHTAPDPAQSLHISADSVNGEQRLNVASDTDLIAAAPGDRITLRTAPILDRNGHIVPDNTAVEFIITFVTDNLQTQQSAQTIDGIAFTSITPTRPGRIQVTARSGEANRSATVQIAVSEPANAPIVALESASDNSEASSARTPLAARPEMHNGEGESSGAQDAETALDGSDPAGTEAVIVRSESVTESHEQLSALDFVLSLFALALMSILGFTTGQRITASASGGVRVVLGSVVAGLTGYIYYGVGGPGTAQLHELLHNLAPMTATLIAGAAGLVYTGWSLRAQSE